MNIDTMKFYSTRRVSAFKWTRIINGDFKDFWLPRLGGTNFRPLDNSEHCASRAEALAEAQKLKEYFQKRLAKIRKS